MESLLGVIIGGFITAVVNVINQHYSLKREEEQFDREQKAKRKEWKKDESENIRDIFKNAHSALTSYIALKNREDLSGESYPEESLELVNDIIDWFSLIALRYPSDSDLSQRIEFFSFTPNLGSADRLKNKLKELVQVENEFFLEKPQDEDLRERIKKEEKTKVLRFRIDDDFRKNQLIQGKELKRNQSLNIDFKELTKTQRKKIVEKYFSSGSNTFADEIELVVPTYNESNNNILYNKTWQAKINPNEVEPSDILSSWEKDFVKSLKEAKKLKD